MLLGIAAVAAILFVLRQRRAANPLYDLHIAARPTFWVAACAGIIVFGSLMGAAYISQQFLQNVLGYSTLDAGAAILPAGIFMVLVAPRSAKLVGLHGSRRTLLTGQAFLLVAFVLMLLFWRENISYWVVAIPYIFLGIGVGPRGHAVLELADGIGAGDAGRHGLRYGRPPARPGRGADDLDLRRAAHRRVRLGDGDGDRQLGEAHHRQHAGDAAALVLRAPRTSPPSIPTTRARSRRPPSRRSSRATSGRTWPRSIAILIGMALVYRFFPKKDAENALRAGYHAQDTGAGTGQRSGGSGRDPCSRRRLGRRPGTRLSA